MLEWLDFAIIELNNQFPLVFLNVNILVISHKTVNVKVSVS